MNLPATLVVWFLTVFAGGWYLGHFWTKSGFELDMAVREALANDRRGPSWLLDESESIRRTDPEEV